ncbi:MAG TPA: thiolase domain-containing protein, partial [bacterium]|nr:thiolase domain-containing protein [bacterium]
MRKPRRRVAVIGAGMSLFMRRALETGKELSYYAASQALESAGVRLKEIQAVVMATAPDAFDGVHMKGDWLLDGAGAVRKPYLRAYVGGGSGVFSIISGWTLVASGLFDLVLVVAEEKMSSCQPHPQGAFLTIFDHTIERPLGPNLLWIFSLEQHRYMATYGIRNEDIALVSVKNKRNALDHPVAQVAASLTVKDVLASEIVAWPVHRLMVSPISDGAAAIVLASEDVAQRLSDKPVWVQGVGWSLDTS